MKCGAIRHALKTGDEKMDEHIHKEYVTEMACGTNFAYILNDNNQFLNTEYQVLQSQTNGCFVPCIKQMYNGKIQLYYLTKGLTPLTTLLYTLYEETFWVLVTHLFSVILDVKHNGFLSCQNINLSFERIYVDAATNKVGLVYLPLSRPLYDDDSSFENELRSSLAKAISTHSNIFTPRTMRFSSELSNQMFSIEELYVYAKQNYYR